MPIRDPERRREAARRWYHRTKDTPRQRENRARRRDAKLRRNRASRANAAQRVEALKVARGCLRCRERHPAVLQFHHCRGKKSFEISRAVANGYSWERIEQEIAKCDVLCANCHMKIHPRAALRQVPRRIRKAFIFNEE